MGKNDKAEMTVYIDEAGDLGFNKGTKWFVLTAVIVEKKDEILFRKTFKALKEKFNVNEIHLRKIQDFFKRIFIAKTINPLPFKTINILVDTSKLEISKVSTMCAYNYICRLLIERVSWFLSENKKRADIVLSARGTSRDNELIEYIKDKLIPYKGNKIHSVFNKICAKSSGEWELLQLADICATTMFLSHEINKLGFRTPCYVIILQNHIYTRNKKMLSYGIKYFDNKMKLTNEEKLEHLICK